MNPVFSFVKAIISPVANLIDEAHFSGEEKAAFKQKMMELESQLLFRVLDYETKLMEHQSSVIKAEANSPNILTSSWRPIVMLGFFGLIVSYWLGYTPPNITEDMLKELFMLIKIGLGGYVIGRSAEKTIPAVAQMFKK